MARNIPELEYERVWTNRQDFKTYEDSEDEVRADLQYHPNAIKDYLNNTILPKLNTINASDITVTGGNDLQTKLSTMDYEIANVTLGQIPDGSLTSAKLDSNAVTTEKLNDGCVTTVKVADGDITTAKIADSGVTAVKIADGSVTTDKLNDNSVTGAKVVEGSLLEDVTNQIVLIPHPLANTYSASANMEFHYSKGLGIMLPRGVVSLSVGVAGRDIGFDLTLSKYAPTGIGNGTSLIAISDNGRATVSYNTQTGKYEVIVTGSTAAANETVTVQLCGWFFCEEAST